MSSVIRVFGRASRSAMAQYRSHFILSPPPQNHHLSNHFHSRSFFKTAVLNQELQSISTLQRFGFSSSATSHPSEKETSHAAQEQGADTIAAEASEQSTETGSTSDSQTDTQSVKGRKRGPKRVAFSDSDSDAEASLDELSQEDLVKLVLEKEELLQKKQTDFASMQDKALRTIAEMENVMERTRREAENSKKFAIQNFAKSLLDVADNLSRASSVVKESFNKIDESKDIVPLLKTLLEGVEMTEKQLVEVFKKYGVEKYDPTNEQFDPNRHNAVFQVPDTSKPPGTVTIVLKAGYLLHDRIIRPAEVGVTRASEDNEAKDSDA